MSATFITATGTEVGKTFVAAALIRYLREAHQTVDALKPLVTGFDPEETASSDPGVLLRALGRTVTPIAIERIAPWRFSAPVSPDLAARLENRTVDFDALLAFCRKAIDNAAGKMLIEGIGGVMVPLDDRHTVLDWIVELDLPVVLIAGSYLGSLSHTLTSLDALRRRNAVITALVVNETPESTVAVKDTMATLKRFAEDIPIFGLPRLPAGGGQHLTLADVAALL
jgi:dethiobiotin synthetase